MNETYYKSKIDELYQSFNSKINCTEQEKDEYYSLMYLYIKQYHKLNIKKNKINYQKIPRVL